MPALIEVRHEPSVETALRLVAGGGIVATNAQPGFHERTHQPRPDGALMVRSVALLDTTSIVRRIAGLTGRNAAQTEWREQSRFDRIDDALRPFSTEQRQRQAPTAKTSAFSQAA
jgi:hypothetical protein